jgi:hypothetical protein
MPNFDAPEADWTDTYDWTRYRGPQPYPCPGPWVLGTVEADGAGWHYYPECNGDAYATDTELQDGEPYDAWKGGPTAKAGLLNDIVEDSRTGPTVLEHRFTISGEVVFKRAGPDEGDLFGSIAEALARYDAGEPISEFAAAVEPTTGDSPAREASKRDLERRREENASLGEWADEH